MEQREGVDSEQRVARVRCPRIDQVRTVEEHLACPYCFGRVREVASGERERFCDYDPARDPCCYGFPEGSSRYQ